MSILIQVTDMKDGSVRLTHLSVNLEHRIYTEDSRIRVWSGDGSHYWVGGEHQRVKVFHCGVHIFDSMWDRGMK